MDNGKWHKRLRDVPNCWEHEDCPAETLRSCPAYPAMGRECWKVTGTKCARGRIITMKLTDKLLHCRNHCDFYRTYLMKSHHDEDRTRGQSTQK